MEMKWNENEYEIRLDRHWWMIIEEGDEIGWRTDWGVDWADWADLSWFDLIWFDSIEDDDSSSNADADEADDVVINIDRSEDADNHHIVNDCDEYLTVKTCSKTTVSDILLYLRFRL